MDNGNVIELLDSLYAMVTEAWSVPLGNDKCIIEREKALEIINDIKAALPTSISEAKRLVAARDEFIGNAKREAEAMRKTRRRRPVPWWRSRRIVRVARALQQRDDRLGGGKSRELRRIASEYVDDIMRQTETSLSTSLATIRAAHGAFQNSGIQQSKPAAAAPRMSSSIVPEIEE